MSLALDIGGANLKAADGLGWVHTEPFPLWRQPEQLAQRLRAVIELAPSRGPIIATMTGELCDCFATKAEGVHRIVASLLDAAESRPVLIYGVGGLFLAPTGPLDAWVEQHWPVVAASNWEATARFAARFSDSRSALVIDIGSTTTDMIPIRDGQPSARGKTDLERLASSELVYSGVERTPVCALVRFVTWRGRLCGVAAELFATSGDAFRILGDLPEDPHNRSTADGRPATAARSRDRLARMVCADRSMLSDVELLQIADEVAGMQKSRIVVACSAVLNSLGESPATWILAGQGEFLARRVADECRIGGETLVSLGAVLGPDVSRVLPAHALAVLAREAGTDE